MKGQETLFSHNSDSWETPQWLFDKLNEEFHFDIDIAASDINHKCDDWVIEEEDALSENNWATYGNIIFCNPPYSQWQKFVKKAYEEHQKSGVLIVMLLPARTDTKAFQDILIPFAEIRFVKGRLTFEINGKPVLGKNGKPQPAPFPSLVAIFRKKN